MTDLLVVGDLVMNDGTWCKRIPFDPKEWESKEFTVLICEDGLAPGK